MREAGIALRDVVLFAADVEGLDHLVLQVGMAQIEAVVDDGYRDLRGAHIAEAAPGIDHLGVGAFFQRKVRIDDKARIFEVPLVRQQVIRRRGKDVGIDQHVEVGLGGLHQAEGLQRGGYL